MTHKVGIVGVGLSKFGRRVDKRLEEVAWEAIKSALRDAGITQKDIDSFSFANAGHWNPDISPAAVVAEYANLINKEIFRVESACASGSAAVKAAYNAVASGEAKIALAVGTEKMTETTTPNAVDILARMGNYFWEFEQFGVTFPAYYAMLAVNYMHKYNATEEDLAQVAVKNHHYGAMNPYAQFRKEITIEDVLKSPYVAKPIKLLDCSPITDGAAAIVLASESIAKQLTDTPVWIDVIIGANAPASFSKRDDYTTISSARFAAERAYKRVGIDPENPTKYLDVADVHDCFTIAEIIAYEDLKFVAKGRGVELIREKQTYIGGKIPVNLDGGLKAKGHPIGASGVAMFVEIAKQLQQRVEKGRQADIKHGRGLTHNVGGTGHYSYISILSI